MKGLYIHIPFCEKICHYCDFVKQVPKNDLVIDDYITALINEIDSYEDEFELINTIYIGGGTPSVLNPTQLERLLKALNQIKPTEFTIEVNPESYSFAKGLIMQKYGVNRVSLGVQSFNDKILKYINRSHTKEQVFNVVNNLKMLGITNISVDLIYAIPGQTKMMLYEDLEQIKLLDIKHVACYSLILEEKTYFHHQYMKGNFKQVDNELEGNMFEIVITELKKQGFMHYEISNFAKDKSFYSKHNLLYWTLGDYIGVGLGAHGFINKSRTYNVKSLNQYKDNRKPLIVTQTKKDLLTDKLIFGLRLLDGLKISEIEEEYQFKLLDKYPLINNSIKDGLVFYDGTNLRLTHKGIFLGNRVFEVFIWSIY